MIHKILHHSNSNFLNYNQFFKKWSNPFLTKDMSNTASFQLGNVRRLNAVTTRNIFYQRYTWLVKKSLAIRADFINDETTCSEKPIVVQFSLKFIEQSCPFIPFIRIHPIFLYSSLLRFVITRHFLDNLPFCLLPFFYRIFFFFSFSISFLWLVRVRFTIPILLFSGPNRFFLLTPPLILLSVRQKDIPENPVIIGILSLFFPLKNVTFNPRKCYNFIHSDTAVPNRSQQLPFHLTPYLISWYTMISFYRAFLKFSAHFII